VAWFRLLRQRHDFHDAVGAARAAQECANLLTAVENPVRREAMLRRMAAWFGGDEGALRRLMKGRAEAAPATPAASPQAPAARPPRDDAEVARLLPGGPAVPGPPTAREAVPPRAPEDRALREAEIDLLACVLAQPELHQRLAALDFHDPQTNDVLAALSHCARQAGLTAERLAQAAFTELAARSPGSAGVLAAAVERARHIREPQAALEVTAAQRRKYLARRAARRVRMELEEARVAGDRAKVDDLTRLVYQQLRHA